MAKKKLCPVLSAISGKAVYCQAERCAWWNTMYNHQTGESAAGECAILTIGDALDAMEKRV